MSYSVIYLENHKCRVCEAIDRNVIEPVAVCVPEGKENIKSKLENLDSKQLEQRLEELYRTVKGKVRTEISIEKKAFEFIDLSTYQICIFHCEKENEIWMKNYDKYKNYVKHKNKTIQKRESFDEDFEIQWNKNLVEKFWRKIRTYRFAVDYKEKWDKFEGTEVEKWEQLKQLLPEKTQKEIEKDKEIILFNLQNFQREIFYNFSFFNFPSFTIFIEEHDSSVVLFFKFFLAEEKFKFKNKTTFEKTKLIGSADFSKIDFEDEAIFENTQFSSEVSFSRAKFISKVSFLNAQFNSRVMFLRTEFGNEVNFGKSQFYGMVDFEKSQFHSKSDFDGIEFYNEANFSETQFHGWTNFWKAKFHSKVYFGNVQFYDETNFGETQFYGWARFWKVDFHSKTYFDVAQFYSEVYFGTIKFHSKTTFIATKFHRARLYLLGSNLLFDLSAIKLSENSKIEIKNLKTYRLVLNDINNISEYFFFYDTEIITLREYKDYAQKENIKIYEEALKEVENSPNLEIVNSHLNQMKFINCDFSKAKHIKIESSDLTEVKFLATDWGDISEKRICPGMFKNQTKKARDVYRQLKLTLDNHRDYFSTNGFYALEMKAQEKILEETLRLKKGKDNIFQDLKILGKLIRKFRKLPKEKYELLVLKIHKLSSDFGQSWTKPLMWIIVFGLFFTGIRITHKEDIPYRFLPEWAGNIFNLLATGLNEFTKSLIPIFSNKKEIEGLEFISLLVSIIIGFLTYQFIVAVRRRVKR